MPINRGHDAEGPFYRWGVKGKKYHYKTDDKKGREKAKAEARKQGRAAKAREGE
jgi:hypothetical protein